jgi:hypothetical protein
MDLAMNMTAVEVPKLRFAEPCHNLPGRTGVATAEDRYTIAFMRAYLRQAKAIHSKAKRDHLAFAREIPVNGYGIADLLVVAWQPLPDEHFPSVEAFVGVTRPCTRAFECKLTDWRRAMSQAARYRFFAHQAFVVLPERTCATALRYLDTFRKIRVGLWSYSTDTGHIVAHYTPRAIEPRSRRYYLHAVACVAAASTQALPISRKV